MSNETTEKIGVLWDLDGTIVDSFELYYAAYWPLLEKYNCPKPPEAEFRHEYRTKYFGRSVESLLNVYAGRPVSDDEMAAMKKDYLLFAEEILVKRGGDCVRMLPGVDRVLNGFYERGCPMAIASTSWLPTIVHTLETIGFLDKFSNIVSGALLPSKPRAGSFPDRRRVHQYAGGTLRGVRGLRGRDARGEERRDALRRHCLHHRARKHDRRGCAARVL